MTYSAHQAKKGNDHVWSKKRGNILLSQENFLCEGAKAEKAYLLGRINT